jgi:hypothetical protein
MGSVNNFAQMCVFINPYKYTGNQFLAGFNGDENVSLPVPDQVKKDLLIVANAAETSRRGLPIAKEPVPPGLEVLHFYTDAAGAKYAMCRGKRIPLDLKTTKGVAGVGLTSSGKVWWWSRLNWSEKLLHYSSDKKGAIYGNKMSTLEAIGILLPLLTSPDKLLGRELVFHVDNISVMYGWDNKGLKHDTSATIMIRCIHLVANYLGAEVHVNHMPRMSTHWARVADSLTREETSTEGVFAELEETPESKVEGALLTWTRNPNEDWELPEKVLADVKRKLAGDKIVLG